MADAAQSGLPEQFLRRQDESPDVSFYRSPRFVTHIDEGAVAAVGELYAELGVDGSSGRQLRVLDLMSSWVSHLRSAPRELVVLGLNDAELAANPMATELAEVARVLRPGAPLVVTFSNRCFPTKAVYGWLLSDDAGRAAIVQGYVRAAGGFDDPATSLRTPDPSTGYRGDPLFAVVATRRTDPPTLAP